MGIRIIIFICCFCAINAFGQKQKTITSCELQFDYLTHREIYYHVDNKPIPGAGLSSLYVDIAKKLKVPQSFSPVNTKIIIGFIVEENGEITGKRIIKNIEGTDFAEQFLELAGEYKWEPGICKGKAIPVFQTLHLIADFN